MKKTLEIRDGKISPSEEGSIFIYVNPSQQERIEIMARYGIDEHNLSSALDPDEISRIEFEDDHLVVIFKRPKNYSTTDNLLFKVTSCGAFLFADKLVIIQPEEIQMLEEKHSQKILTLNDALLRIMYGTIAHFLGHLKVISMISDSIEQKIETSMETKYMVHLYTLQKSLVYYLTGINANTAVIEKLKFYATKLHFTEDNIEMLDDIIIENNQCRNLSRTYAEILEVMTTARNSIVNDKLSTVMKRLTVISCIMLPLTVLTGVGGMSEWSMMTQNVMSWPVSYGVAMVGLVVLAVGTYYFFKWRDWI
jgi:magnesium transporter